MTQVAFESVSKVYDDGTVAVERTKVPGMTDFLTVPCGHTFIMNDRKVIEQVEKFLRAGSFDHAGSGSALQS